MKRFVFRLERVLHLRELEADVESSRLAACEADLRALLAQQEQLSAEYQSQVAATGIAPAERQALTAFRLSYENKQKELEAKLLQQRQLLAERSAACTAARQKVEVLKKVRGKQRQEWERQLQKELDDAAMDSFLARWGSSPSGERP